MNKKNSFLKNLQSSPIFEKLINSFFKRKKSIKQNTKLNKIQLKKKKYQKIISSFIQFSIDEKNLKKKKRKKDNYSLLTLKNFNKSKKFERLSLILQKFKKDFIFRNQVIRKNVILLLKKSSHSLKLTTLLKNNNLLSNKSHTKKYSRNEKYNQKIGIVFYSDHVLILTSLSIDLDNNIKYTGLTEIPIPANIIGNYLVEDINELANILLDGINLLDLVDSPLLVILSSSFFNIHTFSATDLKQISPKDSMVQSKSPYLPANTLIDFLRINISNSSNGFIRTIYSQKDLIRSWTDTLEIVDNPLIGLVPHAPNVFDYLSSKIIDEKIILIDIESASTTVLIGRKLDKLFSYKLPFGSSLYISDDLEVTSKNYFERVINSIKIILDDNNEELISQIFVMGIGLDKLVHKDDSLPLNFKRVSDLKLTNFSYNPKDMEIHELISKSIETNIDSFALILKSCV
tara:strand:- start:4598 stop:5974 length:1377 start_codon:yes stop_codon:yes gene_type:complete